MQQKSYAVLIIDDHPLIVEAYKSAIQFYSKQNENVEFSIDIAENCDTALALIKEFSTKKNGLDVVFLDISLPPSTDGTILSGEDLGIKINEVLPNTKIIVSTTLNDNYRTQSILKSVNPDGFLIKNDITPQELVEAIGAVITDPPYYSKTLLKLLRKNIENDSLLDATDRKILHELSLGTKMKDLPNILPLSLAGIEKRKRQIKEAFGIKNMDDKELLLTAKEKGFI